MKKDFKKYAFSIVLLIGLTGFALWYVLKDDKDAVLAELSSISPLNFIGIMACSLFYFAFVALSLYVIAKEKYPHYKFLPSLSNAYVGGFFSGISWVLSGVLWCITIIGIPYGKQCFKFAALAFAPFGKDIEYGGGVPSLFANIIWIIFFILYIITKIKEILKKNS